MVSREINFTALLVLRAPDSFYLPSFSRLDSLRLEESRKNHLQHLQPIANIGIRTDVGNLKPFNIYPLLKVEKKNIRTCLEKFHFILVGLSNLVFHIFVVGVSSANILLSDEVNTSTLVSL